MHSPEDLFPYGAEHLLYRCGFEVESVVGDYNNGPVTRKSKLIFRANLQNECTGSYFCENNLNRPTRGFSLGTSRMYCL
jgi:hypothetical protein